MVRLGSIFANFHPTAAGAQTNSDLSLLKKHSGLEIAGVFIVLAAIFLIGVAMHGESRPAIHKSAQVQPATTQIKTSQTPANSASVVSPVNSQTNSSSSVSTNVSTNTSGNGHTSMQVTVNGQPVNVPANGSTQQDIGNTHVEASSTQSSSGSSLNVNSTSTNVNTFTDSDVSTQEGN